MKSFKTKINPNNKQRSAFMQHAGVARHAWNWGLGLCIDRIYKGEKTPTAIDLHKLLVKDVKSANPWYYESSKCAPQQALRDLHTAMQKFWKLHKQNKNVSFEKKYLKKFIRKWQQKEISNLTFEHEKGFPKFKRKGEHDGFYLEGNFQIKDNKIKIPKIGWIKTYEELPVGVDIKNIVISRTADEWFIAFKIDTKPEVKKNINTKTIGVDLGVKTLATLSDGKSFDSPKAYKRYKSKLRQLQKKLSRQYEEAKKTGEKTKTSRGKEIVKTGTNYQKTKIRLAKTHQRIANIRLDNTHKITSYLAKNHSRVTIEDLNVSGMVKNHNLASSILDGGFYEFKRQLQYKCLWNGTELVIADRWFASSQICSCCKHRQHMPLKQRIFLCTKCGIKIDRDLNAAINLDGYTSSYGAKACGDAKFHATRQVSVTETGIRHQRQLWVSS